MGEHNVEEFDQLRAQTFMKAVLNDLRALAFMLENNLVESGVRRIGAEQEMFLVDSALRPAPVSLEVLEKAGDPRLTTEIARFNLEANLSPQTMTGHCFAQMEKELAALIAKTRAAANTIDADVLLSGILPTLQKSDLTLDNLAPIPRYRELNRGVIRLRGGPFAIHIKGLDELQFTHDNIMMESCNTSFQIHFESSPREFVSHYNAAQAITAPVLAAAVNSPMLFGKRLWQETRVALFQHSTDARSGPQLARSHPTRVSFGDAWLKDSVIALFHDQVSRFRPIILSEPDEDPFHLLARGGIPLLTALRTHNGTVWRWNRACYGVIDGQAHLRIENRALPSGPTVVDEVANAVFFVGLMLAIPNQYGDVAARMMFDDAKSNFFRAARHGLDAQFNWIDSKSYPATELILNELLPHAREALIASSVDETDVDRYLGIIRDRVESRQTGARWIVKSIAAIKESGSKEAQSSALAATMLACQKGEQPVHTWPLAEKTEYEWEQQYQTVGQFMSTDLFTAQPDDLIDLAASVMDWRHIRHVPVEDEKGRLVGLVTHRNLLRLISQGIREHTLDTLTVSEVMVTQPFTVSPSMPTLEAIDIMREHRIGCLPVVEGEHLVGIVTSYDFLEASARFFREKLSRPKAPVQRAIAKSA
jgi:CBS domain-containing protein/gamma-glutamyl:cysteine ligase YbdK (ATP-grasp superfamily)